MVGPEFKYSQVEKLALAAVHVMKRLRNYILPRKKIVVAKMNPVRHILSHRIIGDKYSKWIVIFQEFDLEFINAKGNKSLTFVELVSELLDNKEETLISHFHD